MLSITPMEYRELSELHLYEFLPDEPLDFADIRLELMEDARILAPAYIEDGMDAYDPEEELGRAPDVELNTVDDIFQEIETNLWLAQAYREHSAEGLARECASAAFQTWRQFHDVLQTYAGSALRDRVVRLAVELNVPGASPSLLNH